jgi:DNA polymerase-3 subunit gamma/tau
MFAKIITNRIIRDVCLMSYLVLARKFRPQNFDEVIGQEHISQTLKNAIFEKRIAHAYLFSGPRGCGKTTMARIFAKALNCKSGPTIKPCGVCGNCVEISKSLSVDVLEIDGASNNGIDEIRALRENVKFSTASSKYKIYIIDEAHQITTQAFNALLKTLEEPPSHVVFIMATTEQHKIPVTILSRCQRYRFKLILSDEMVRAIRNIEHKEGFEIDEEALNIVTSASGGSMRDALSLLDQAVSSKTGKITGDYMRGLLGLLPKDIIVSVTDNIAKNDIYAILKIVKEIYEQGYNILQFTRDLRDHLRNVMIYSINPSIAEISSEDKKIFDIQKTLFTVSRHVRMNNLLSKVLEEMRWHDQPRILLEMYLLKISEPYYDVGELINKITDLEKNVSICSNSQLPFEKQLALQSESYAVGRISDPADLTVVWNEIVSEIIKEHSLSAQPLKNALIKIESISSIQLVFSKQFDYDSALEFQDQISKFFQKMTGLNVAIKIIIEKNISKNKAIQKDTSLAKEDPLQTKENAKIRVPKYIEEIAKKFSSIAKKI